MCRCCSASLPSRLHCVLNGSARPRGAPNTFLPPKCCVILIDFIMERMVECSYFIKRISFGIESPKVLHFLPFAYSYIRIYLIGSAKSRQTMPQRAIVKTKTTLASRVRAQAQNSILFMVSIVVDGFLVHWISLSLAIFHFLPRANLLPAFPHRQRAAKGARLRLRVHKRWNHLRHFSSIFAQFARGTSRWSKLTAVGVAMFGRKGVRLNEWNFGELIRCVSKTCQNIIDTYTKWFATAIFVSIYSAPTVSLACLLTFIVVTLDASARHLFYRLKCVYNTPKMFKGREPSTKNACFSSIYLIFTEKGSLARPPTPHHRLRCFARSQATQLLPHTNDFVDRIECETPSI